MSINWTKVAMWVIKVVGRAAVEQALEKHKAQDGQ